MKFIILANIATVECTHYFNLKHLFFNNVKLSLIVGCREFDLYLVVKAFVYSSNLLFYCLIWIEHVKATVN